MTFPSNDLEITLQRAFANEISVDEFVQALLVSTVWVPLTTTTEGHQSMPTVTIDQQALLPVFTSEEQLHLGAPDAPRVAPPVSELLTQLPAHVGLAVNVGGDVGLPIFAAGLQQARGGAATLSTGTSVRIGAPADELAELFAQIGQALQAVGAVREARRCWAQVGDNRPGLVVGLDVDPDNPDTRMAAMDAVREAVGTSAKDFPVDVVFTSDRDTFTEWMTANAQPFYSAG